MEHGAIVWFTGLSGSGKSTVSRIAEDKLKQMGVSVEVLDGDELRQRLSPELGFTSADRLTHIRRAIYIARLLSRHGILVLVPFITPYKEMRELCRNELHPLVEVYVKCPLRICAERDVKGLYRKALAGEIGLFTGVSDRFDEPEAPDLTLETGRESAEESAGRLIAYLMKRRLLR